MHHYWTIMYGPPFYFTPLYFAVLLRTLLYYTLTSVYGSPKSSRYLRHFLIWVPQARNYFNWGKSWKINIYFLCKIWHNLRLSCCLQNFPIFQSCWEGEWSVEAGWYQYLKLSMETGLVYLVWGHKSGCLDVRVCLCVLACYWGIMLACYYVC